MQHLQDIGVELVEVHLNDVLQVAKAVSGASCVVSALAGLKDVIVDTQLAILQGAIKAQDPDLLMNFTTIDDTVIYTVAVALDPSAPRTLHIAGDKISARELAVIMSEVSGKKFTLLRAGSLSMLERLIKVTRVFVPGKNSTYPVWQGMQYLHNMFSSGLAHPSYLDNERYPGFL